MKTHTGCSHILLLAALANVLSVTTGCAWAAKADGGYEANRLPSDAGWTELGSSFLGDYVRVADGLMTYDGKANPAPGASGMKLADFPLQGPSGTIEFRLRCRAVGGNSKKWYQYFLTTAFYCEKFAIFTSLGRSQGWQGKGHEIISYLWDPETSATAPPPTRTGTWNTNEWITVRYIIRDAGNSRSHVEGWISGPAGTKKFLDVTKDHPSRSPEFWIRVNHATSQTAAFDLDYIRWSNNVVLWPEPLLKASTAPTVMSISPNSSSNTSPPRVTIKGIDLDAETEVLFGTVPASDVRLVNPSVLTCLVPSGTGPGWVDVQVRNADGSHTLDKGFFCGVLPEVEGICPAQGTNLGGQTVTIRGRGFQDDASVHFSGIPADQVKVIDSDSILCRTPAALGHWSGLADVMVTNPDGGYSTAKDSYVYNCSSEVQPRLLGWLLELHDFNLPIAIQKLEEMPFHGVILRPDCCMTLHNGTVTQEEIDRDTNVLKAVEFTRFKDNFLYTSIRGKDIPSLDFFEDWTGVITGYHCYAKMARDIGFRGIWLDLEDYLKGRGADLCYATRNDKSKSFAEYEEQVRLRGRQIALAMLSEFPDIQILTTFGLGVGENPIFDLLPAFIDGMLEAVASDPAYARARIIDGYEEGYYITTPDDYRKAYDRMRKPGGIAYQRTNQDQAWADHGAAAFGVWPGGRSVPDFKVQLSSASRHTDQYIWVYVPGNSFSFNNIVQFGKGQYIKDTDRYIQILVDATGFPRATPSGRHLPIGQWRMEDGHGDVAVCSSGVGFDGVLSSPDVWTNDTPTLPRLSGNNWALDFRGNNHYLRIDRMGYLNRPSSSSATSPAATGTHLGNLYFVDHTIEFSFWWDGQTSATPQYLYGADGGEAKAGKADTFAYAGWIPPRTRKFVHWQRGNWGRQYGDTYGGVEIDLAAAQEAGLYQFGRWANVAIEVRGIDSCNWQIFLNGKNVTNQPWAGVHKGHETVGGYKTPQDGKWRLHAFLLDLVLGARNADELGTIQPFDGMLDEFRISAGQVPAQDLLCVE